MQGSHQFTYIKKQELVQQWPEELQNIPESWLVPKQGGALFSGKLEAGRCVSPLTTEGLAVAQEGEKLKI